MSKSGLVCEWFEPWCTRPAAGFATRPVWRLVPICQECAERFGLTMFGASSGAEVEK